MRSRRSWVRLISLREERGSSTLEMLIVGPSLVALALFLVFVGRSVTTGHAIDEAARSAARAASMATSPAQAQADAQTAAAASLEDQHVHCEQITVIVAASSIGSRTAGATARVEITCTVNMADLALPGAGLDLPASKTFTSTFASPIDPHRDF